DYIYSYYIKNLGILDLIKEREPIFAIIEKVVGEISGYNIVVLMCVLAIITVVAMFIFLSKESEIVWLSVILTLTIGSYFTSFNTTRNYMSAAVFVLFSKYVYENKPVKYIITVVVLALVHTSALALIPLYWLLRINWSAKGKKSLALVFFAVYLMVFFGLESFLQFIHFRYMYLFSLSDWAGTSVVSSIRQIFILLIVLINRNMFSLEDMRHRMWMNATIYLLAIQLLSTKYYLIYRYTYFLLPLALLAIVHVISSCKSAKKKRFWTIIVLTFSLIWAAIGQFTMNYSFFWEENVNYFG
ncbi:MAG: EpsG family protein, partial [Lachnospiraceae bacterium]|nr:EpsG family protein [Lachnospiraceae bacterium]